MGLLDKVQKIAWETYVPHFYQHDDISISVFLSAWYQALVLLAKLRLEPAVFIFFVCYGVFFATSQQLYIEKACKVRLDINHLILGGKGSTPEIVSRFKWALPVRSKKSSIVDLVLMRTKLLKWSSFSPHFTQKASFSPDVMYLGTWKRVPLL